MCAVSLDRLIAYHKKNPNATRADLEAHIREASKGKNITPKIQHQIDQYLSTVVDRPAAEAVVAATNPLNVTPKAQEAIEELRTKAAERTRYMEPSGKSTTEWQKELAAAFNKKESEVQIAGGRGQKEEVPASEPYISSKKQKEAKRAQNEAQNEAKNAAEREAQKAQKELRNQEAKETAKAYEAQAEAAKPRRPETGLPGEKVDLAEETATPKKRIRHKHKRKGPEAEKQVLGKTRGELVRASEAENVNRQVKPTKDWKVELQEAVDSGKIELDPVKEVVDEAKPGTGNVAEEVAEESKGIFTRLKNLLKRIGKKGWIGIAIASVALITGIAIHRHNKNKAQKLNVNA